MPPRTLAQNQIIKKEKRKLILETALKVFSDYGFHASTISHIAQKANISKGLLYNYFENKEDLLKTIIFDFADPILEKYPIENYCLSNKDVEFFIDKSFDFVLEDTNRSKLLFSISSQPGVIDVIIGKLMDKAMPFMNLLTAYFKSRNFKDPESMMYYFFSVIDGVSMNIITNPNFPTEKVRILTKNQFIK